MIFVKKRFKFRFLMNFRFPLPTIWFWLQFKLSSFYVDYKNQTDKGEQLSNPWSPGRKPPIAPKIKNPWLWFWFRRKHPRLGPSWTRPLGSVGPPCRWWRCTRQSAVLSAGRPFRPIPSPPGPGHRCRIRRRGHCTWRPAHANGQLARWLRHSGLDCTREEQNWAHDSQ